MPVGFIGLFCVTKFLGFRLTPLTVFLESGLEQNEHFWGLFHRIPLRSSYFNYPR